MANVKTLSEGEAGEDTSDVPRSEYSNSPNVPNLAEGYREDAKPFTGSMISDNEYVLAHIRIDNRLCGLGVVDRNCLHDVGTSRRRHFKLNVRFSQAFGGN